MSSININVRVLLNNNQQIDISCGKAQQSFQWLATVVQQRIKQFHLMRKSLQDEAFIVTEIRNQEGELINPQDKLYEHVGNNGLVVRAILATSYPVDDWENPKINDWMQVAYIHSKAGFQWATEIEGWRQTLSAAQEGDTVPNPSQRMPYLPHANSNNNNTLNKKMLPTQSSLIQIGEHFTPQDIEKAFNLDWQAMSWRWIATTPTPFSDIIRSRLGIVLKENYGLICNLFVHYAGEGRLGQRYGMTMQEFGHCLHFAKILDWKFSEEAIKRIFLLTASESMQRKAGNYGSENIAEGKDSNGDNSRRLNTADSKQNSYNEQKNSEPAPRNGFAVKKSNPEDQAKAASDSNNTIKNCPLMTRAHFAEALVCIALEERFGSQVDEAARALFHGPLGEFWHGIQDHYVYYTSDERVLIHQAIHDFAVLLRQMFHQYAVIDSTFGARLYLSDFIQMVQDAGILTESDQENVCTAALLAAQLTPTVQQEQEYVVFAEFVEALSRVSVKSIASYAGLTDGKKIRMAFNMVIEMITNDRPVIQAATSRVSNPQRSLSMMSAGRSMGGSSHMSRK